DFKTTRGVAEGTDRLTANIGLQSLNVQALSGGATPASLLTGKIALEADTLPRKRELSDIGVNAQFTQGSTWNDKALSGAIRSKVHLAGIFDKQTEEEQADHSIKPNLDKLRVNDTDIDLQLGNNRITAHGGFGE